MKFIGIVQSNYIPWKGYFDLINRSDEFVLYDEMQFTRRDWRNRNVITTSNGPLWLTIPVQKKGRFEQKISETLVIDGAWAENHLKSIFQNYARAPYFAALKPFMSTLYSKAADLRRLSEINHLFLSNICELLEIKTKLKWSSDFQLAGAVDSSDRLARLCKESNANVYISGPSATDYINEADFEKLNVQLRFIDYSKYPTYRQLFGEFTHNVSIIDTLYNCGPEAVASMLQETKANVALLMLQDVKAAISAA